MTDIVERLRTPVMLHADAEQTNAERREAAAEIERLRKAGRALLETVYENENEHDGYIAGDREVREAREAFVTGGENG